MPDDRVKKAKLAAEAAAAAGGPVGGGIKKKEARPSAGAGSRGSSSSGGGGSGSGIRDRGNCALLKREGDTEPKSKTAVFTCAGCGAILTGFTAWRNHMKKSSSFKKCAPPLRSALPLAVAHRRHNSAHGGPSLETPPCSSRAAHRQR